MQFHLQAFPHLFCIVAVHFTLWGRGKPLQSKPPAERDGSAGAEPAPDQTNSQNRAPKGFRPGFGPKRGFRLIPRLSSLIAGPGAAKLPKSGSKKLPARIWPKTAVSQWSQKRNSIAGRGAAKWQKFASKRLPARIWPKTGISAHSHIQQLNSRPSTRQASKIGLRKVPWPRSGPKRPFQLVPQLETPTPINYMGLKANSKTKTVSFKPSSPQPSNDIIHG